MDSSFKKTFNNVHMDKEKQEAIRLRLESQLSACDKEDVTNTTVKIIRRPAAVLIAAVLTLSFTLAAYAYGSQIFKSLTGSTIETENHENGGIISKSYIIDAEQESPPAEVIDKKIIFTLDGSDKDITDLCSEQNYYAFEFVDENKWKQIVTVGGTVDNMGYAVFIFNEDGDFEAGHSSQTRNEFGEFEWYINAKEKYIGEIINR